MGTRIKKRILKEEQMARIIHKEVFNFPGYKRDANQKYTQISSHPS
jgi:hypothetical protein